MAVVIHDEQHVCLVMYFGIMRKISCDLEEATFVILRSQKKQKLWPYKCKQELIIALNLSIT